MRDSKLWFLAISTGDKLKIFFPAHQTMRANERSVRIFLAFSGAITRPGLVSSASSVNRQYAKLRRRSCRIVTKCAVDHAITHVHLVLKKKAKREEERHCPYLSLILGPSFLWQGKVDMKTISSLSFFRSLLASPRNPFRMSKAGSSTNPVVSYFTQHSSPCSPSFRLHPSWLDLYSSPVFFFFVSYCTIFSSILRLIKLLWFQSICTPSIILRVCP